MSASVALQSQGAPHLTEAARVWFLAGFLPEKPHTKVWIKIEGDIIFSISETPPQRQSPMPLVVDTQGLIFPGLIDLLGHSNNSGMPLWPQARGQFANRFEWRKHATYRDGVSFQRSAFFDPQSQCALQRFAALKALVGGTTLFHDTEGASQSNDHCKAQFATRKTESAADMENNQPVHRVTHVIAPHLISSVFNPLIGKFLNSPKVTHDQALDSFIKEQGLEPWIKSFTSRPQTALDALNLALGMNFEENFEIIEIERPAQPRSQKWLERLAFVPKNKQNTPTGGAKLSTQAYSLRELLAGPPFQQNLHAIERTIGDLPRWIEAYLALTDRPRSVALEFVASDACLVATPDVRNYLSGVEVAVRSHTQASLQAKGALGVIAKLAEGRREDPFNASEYAFAKHLGLIQEGFIVAHGLGLAKEDFEDASAAKVSLVWSPFSNLLLYGETLNLPQALRAGLNIALGSSGSHIGSRNLLGELKVARQYLDVMQIKISDRLLVEMATSNAARAIRREAFFGKIAPGFKADILVVRNQKLSNPYASLVQASEADVLFVSVDGQPRYGLIDVVTQASRYFNDDKPAAIVLVKDPSTKQVAFQRAFRLPIENKIIARGPPTDSPSLPKPEDAHTPSGLEAYLRHTLAGSIHDFGKGIGKSNKREKSDASAVNSSTLNLSAAAFATLFALEEPSDSQRRADFISQEWHSNMAKRLSVREAMGLTDTWNPLDEGPGVLGD